MGRDNDPGVRLHFDRRLVLSAPATAGCTGILEECVNEGPEWGEALTSGTNQEKRSLQLAVAADACGGLFL